MSELIRREDVRREIQASFDDGAFRWKDGQDLMDRINALPTVSPWHRVEEGLPNVDEKVLVFAIGKLDGFIGDTVIALTSMSDTNWLNHHEKVDKPYWLDPWQYFLTDYRITHWMPLPEPLKEEADADK